MTDLKAFVSETIQEIMEGVLEAGKKLNDKIEFERDGFFQIGDGMIHKVEFDISVTTAETTKTEGRAGIMIKVVDFGIKGSENVKDMSTNKIRFSVPIGYPESANKKF